MNRSELFSEMFTDVHYTLGRFISYYSINGTLDSLVGPSIVSERQRATSPLTPASMSAATLQQQLATTLNESVAVILSRWSDKRFFTFSQHGSLFLQNQVDAQLRMLVIAGGNTSASLDSRRRALN